MVTIEYGEKAIRFDSKWKQTLFAQHYS